VRGTGSSCRQDPSKKTVPPCSTAALFSPPARRPFAPARPFAVAYYRVLGALKPRLGRFISRSADLVAFPSNTLFSRYIAHHNAQIQFCNLVQGPYFSSEGRTRRRTERAASLDPAAAAAAAPPLPRSFRERRRNSRDRRRSIDRSQEKASRAALRDRKSRNCWISLIERVPESRYRPFHVRSVHL